MPRVHADRSEVAGPEAAPATVGQLLATWRPAPVPARELRRLHAAALNAHVARALVAAGVEAAAPLVERARASSWTTPAIAFAQYGTIGAGRTPRGSQLDRVLADLATTADGPAPPLRLGGRAEIPLWADYAMNEFSADQAREGRTVRWSLALEDPYAEQECRAALALVARAWPAMADVLEAFVGEVMWYASDVAASRSLVVAQAFGVVFVHREADRIEAAEHLVHEGTHLELVARMAVDPLVKNRDATARSPFRTEPRPLGRVLHACLVSARLVVLMDRLLGVVPENARPRLRRRRGVVHGDFLVAMSSLADAAEWTPRGHRLFEGLRRLQSEVAEPPPEAVSR